MTDDRLEALRLIRFNWAQMEEDVWRGSPFHVDGLHDDIKDGILAGIDEAGRAEGGNPIGLVVEGQKGAGKTHLLGWVRERAQAEGGFFFLVSLHEGSTFWEDVLLALLDGLLRPAAGGGTQVRTFLQRLVTRAGVADDVAEAVVGDAALSPKHLDSFGAALVRMDRRIGRESQDVARALALYASQDLRISDLGDDYLRSLGDTDPVERGLWGLRRLVKGAQLVVRDISQLVALTGPSIIAVDQVDALLAPSMTTAKAASTGEAGEVAEPVANGLMALRETTRRTLTVVACLPTSWRLIRERAVDTVGDRFRPSLVLGPIRSAEVARALVERRLGKLYGEVGFHPPHPTWPVAAEAFEAAADYTPRSLLRRIDEHVQDCLRAGTAVELRHLDQPFPGEWPATGPGPGGPDVAHLDERFAELRRRADVAGAFDPRQEDEVVPALLRAGLDAWRRERGEFADQFVLDPPPGPKPALHARLRRTLVEELEDEVHWSFRGVSHDNAIAALNRLRTARTASGLAEGTSRRHLCLLRNSPWSNGAQTQRELTAFAQAGGERRPVSPDDLRTFRALAVMLEESDRDLDAWLVARQAATTSEVLADVLADATVDLVARPASPATAARPHAGTAYAPDALFDAAHEPLAPAAPVPAARVPAARVPAAPVVSYEDGAAVTFGASTSGNRPVQVALRGLTKHTVIFAGSGSGKTVLIRRLVEECALAGVSAIVLDPNNDLARLGDPWPEPPLDWYEDDFGRSEQYLSDTDVVVWTPGRSGGRPLAFQPLPDFASVLDDVDEFNQAIDAAMGALVPRARVDGAAARAEMHRAVLRQALQAFAREGGGTLEQFVGLLADLPDDASRLADARKVAAGLAETLQAAMINDRLFGGEGQPVDPGELLRPAPGKRARVSVVSFVGLADEMARQSFVNQFQMALFAWFKRNADPSRPLGGLLVMDEAQTLVPATGTTVCSGSTLMLAQQARKYGLGLVFATQAVTGLHNQVSSNAATQVLGRMNAPRQIDAARELARSKGGDVPDIGRLGHGLFYVALEGGSYRQTRTPMCLSHHPPTPLTTEEVLLRARQGG